MGAACSPSANIVVGAVLAKEAKEQDLLHGLPRPTDRPVETVMRQVPTIGQFRDRAELITYYGRMEEGDSFRQARCLPQVISRINILLVIPLLCALMTVRAPGEEPAAAQHRLEQVAFNAEGRHQELSGRVLVEAADGGILLQTDDGTLWPIQGPDMVSRKSEGAPFVPASREQIAKRLLAELAPGFRVHPTPHYVVCYNTSRQYAEWTSALFERLYKAFTNYWQRQGLVLHEPEFPLVVMVYSDRATYHQAGRDELGSDAGSIVGYYSLRTNRVSMFDLTGLESVREPAHRRGSLKEINQMLAQPLALPLVATVVHEATHQIAFNCGLQTRFADIPLWLCEGMAVYFETPDLSSSRGWRGIGRVNYMRLDTFDRNLPTWNSRRLESLLASDKLFRDGRTAPLAYADAWALNYYLIKHRSDEYAEYVKMMASKPPLINNTPDERLTEFREHFGDLARLEQDFLRQMSRVK